MGDLQAGRQLRGRSWTTPLRGVRAHPAHRGRDGRFARRPDVVDRCDARFGPARFDAGEGAPVEYLKSL